MIIWLIGFMGSGKSTTGEKLSALSGMEWYDTDEAIVKTAGKSIPEIFRQIGEPAFRKMESDMFRILSDKKNIIVSVGGGFPCHDGLMDKMKSCGTVFYLKYPVDVLAKRLLSETGSRPLLAGLADVNEIESHIGKLLEVREADYRKAHMVLENDHEPSKTIYAWLKTNEAQSR